MRALISVNDKSGIVPFARGLVDLGWEIISTGNTAAVLRAAQIPVMEVSAVTGAPEMLDGRVKTLHPAIHGAILARRDVPSHMAQLAEQGMTPIDLVAVNLYDFAGTVARSDVLLEDAIEQIDIGGVALLRAAAKNSQYVITITRPEEYPAILEVLQSGAEIDLVGRRRLAAAAFAHTAAYDALIAQYLGEEEPELWPEDLALPLRRQAVLRYGENPHQRAAFYRWLTPGEDHRATIAMAETLHGKELSYNNLMDLDAALGVVRDFTTPTVAIIKHAAPCGVATDPDLETAFRRARAGDPISAFGGIIALNRPVDLATAQAIREGHYDAIIAPEYADDALQLLEKRKNLILVATHKPIAPAALANPLAMLDARRLSGGLLLQTPDQVSPAAGAGLVADSLLAADSPAPGLGRRVVTQRAPDDREIADLAFAWQVVKHVKSNAIVLAMDNATVGLCGGQPNRVDSIRMAAMRAGERSQGSVLASDAYLPFGDNIDVAVAAGVRAIIQPGGSIRDAEVIAAADAAGIAMLFTGFRTFRH